MRAETCCRVDAFKLEKLSQTKCSHQMTTGRMLQQRLHHTLPLLRTEPSRRWNTTWSAGCEVTHHVVRIRRERKRNRATVHRAVNAYRASHADILSMSGVEHRRGIWRSIAQQVAIERVDRSSVGGNVVNDSLVSGVGRGGRGVRPVRVFVTLKNGIVAIPTREGVIQAKVVAEFMSDKGSVTLVEKPEVRGDCIRQGNVVLDDVVYAKRFGTGPRRRIRVTVASWGSF